MSFRGRAWMGGALLLAALASGCATLPPPTPGAVSSPMPGREPEPVKPRPTASGPAATPAPAPTAPAGTQVGTTASGGTITQTGPSVAPRDSTPSADAEAVLRTIPDPVTGASETRPANGAAPPAAAAPADTATLAAQPDSGAAPADTVQADVPTPAPTQPLGDRPGARAVTDTSAASLPAAPASPPPATGGPPASAPAEPCWKVQVAAVPEAPRAAALREAAQSQLLVPMEIVTEKKLHKIRTVKCLTAEGAEQIKRRAIAAGFRGSFRFQPPR